MLQFTVTLYGTSEHDVRNVAQALWTALEKAHEGRDNRTAMLIGELKSGLDDSPVLKPIDLHA
jgi:hypothetical protein